MAFSSAEILEDFAEETGSDVTEYSYAHVFDGVKGVTVANRNGAHNPIAQAEYQKRRRKKARLLGWPAERVRSQKQWDSRKPCECGCGKLTTGGNRRFLHKHWHRTAEAIARSIVLLVLGTGWSTPGPSGGKLTRFCKKQPRLYKRRIIRRKAERARRKAKRGHKQVSRKAQRLAS